MKFRQSKFRFTKMKTIIAVALFGILISAFANDAGKTINCQQVTAMPDFNATQFFRGTWYVTHAKYGETATLCQKFKFENNSKDKVDMNYGYHVGSDLFKFHCNGSKETEVGKYSFDCTANITWYEINEKVYLTVIGTDYNKFAVFYMCFKEGETYINDNFLTFSQNKDDMKNTEGTKVLREKQQLSLDDSRSRKDHNCLEVRI